MSSTGQEQFAMDQLTATDTEPKKEPQFSYSRDFLLSLSELDACKKLPSGFDNSLLSEFEDAPQDRPRIGGGFSSHGFRRNNDYSSSPPTRGDPGSYSRGRWDNRSSGRNDKDSDSHPDWDSESGRRYGQSRRSWQGPEHDGLLGSGSFPRPTVPKPRTNDNNQLNRVNEPYQPPRPYKAAPYSRRDSDSINDETFGSVDSTNDDSTEEERKRRVAFESMRKEQHKVLQEKQKSNIIERRKDEFDISTLNDDDDDNIDKAPATKNNALDEAGNSESGKSMQSLTLASRPLVPPGFSNATMDRNSGTKASAHLNSTEIVNSGLESKLLNLKDSQILSGPFGNQEKKSGLVEQQLGNNGSNSVDAALNLEVAGNKIGNLSDQGGSTTILDKLFGSAMIPDGGATSSIVELNDGKENDAWNPRIAQSSKFAHWFSEEDRKPLDGLSSGRSNDLLLLIVGNGENSETHVSDVNITSLIPTAIGKPEQFNFVGKTEPGPPALTCEDLEQSILSELREKDPSLHTWSTQSDLEMKNEKPVINNHASQHLLSLLMKGPGLEMEPSTKLESGFSIQSAASDSSVKTNAENVASSGEPLALGTLFGNAFMKELQSIGAPVSAQRGPIGSDENSSQNEKTKSKQFKSDIIRSELGGFDEEILLLGRDPQNLSSQETPVDIAEKLAALSSGFQVERSMVGSLEGPGPFFRQGPYDPREPNNRFHNPQIQLSSSPQLNSHVGQLFHPSESHPSNINPQMKFMAPEGAIRHGTPQNQQFLGNLVRPQFHHQGSGHNGFDPSAPHPILQQMQRPGNINFPPSHVLRGFPGGTPLPPQSNNHVGPGLMPGVNPMQGLPFAQQQHNFAVPGMQPRAPEVGNGSNNQAEAFQRLIQMELNSKQMHPSLSGRKNQGSYNGHEVDLGFGFSPPGMEGGCGLLVYGF
ncbi:hypothetical protein ACFE04_016675 [Oxalis oulophora]